MKEVLGLVLLFAWFVAYYKYEVDQSKGLRTMYVLFMRLVIACLSGWTVGGIVSNIIFHY